MFDIGFCATSCLVICCCCCTSTLFFVSTKPINRAATKNVETTKAKPKVDVAMWLPPRLIQQRQWVGPNKTVQTDTGNGSKRVADA